MGRQRKGRSLIDSTSLFSAPEGAARRSGLEPPPPTTHPFQAPDFGEDEAVAPDDPFASAPL
ncbi:hypothetical protein FRZ00_05190 [Streptomyces mobaraensis]|uniref:Uncharacterized protein n=1 Tax=Streptomyces mobaraensis TaxID=35621 RepID=A0A5N5WCL3_STRMB|nr:hypothetical protein FRZ00_05190 [Streptomyces mobaraensis]